jgi:hypothetical protein
MKNFNPVDYRTVHVSPISLFRMLEKGQLVVDKLLHEGFTSFYGITEYNSKQCCQIIGNCWDHYPCKSIICNQTINGVYHTNNQIPLVLQAYMYNKFTVEGILYKDMQHIAGLFEDYRMLLFYVQPSQKDKTNINRFYQY